MKFNRIESILATGIYLFILILLYSKQSPDMGTRQALWLFGYTTTIYGCFMLVSQLIVPRLFRQRKIEIGILLSVILFFGTWLGLALSAWVKGEHWGHRQSIWDYLPEGETLGATLMVFAALFAYEATKRAIGYAQGNKEVLGTRIARESLIVLGVGTLIFFLLLSLEEKLGILWLSAIPYSYLLYALCVYWLIPLCEKKKIGYLPFAIGLSFVLFIPFGTLFINITKLAGAVYIVEWLCLTVIVLPLSHYVYHRQKVRLAQLFNLRMALGQTSADLSFLRSQINPHFLFNILNTLYGTALQEDAERTASGIQKLGDMMRFMLHENNQDRILLAREIEYLRNYIDLQLLRTVTSPGIVVECDINDALDGTYVAPMLLIPFVENAFKHGISLQERSWIKISLHEADGSVYFDVHNSIHRKADSDPERGHSGIGLENVKQRLAMLYPGKHELVIRETAQEFFVHLTIQR